MIHTTPPASSAIPRDILRPRSRAAILAATLLVACALVSGCVRTGADPAQARAETDPDRVVDLRQAPDWVTSGCRSHWASATERRGLVCGVGSAPASRDRVAARETAIARARSAIARSIEVTIESLVRLEEASTTDGGEEARLETIAHQLTSASLPGCEVVSVWRSRSGEVHALVALPVERIQHSVRETEAIPIASREELARRAAEAFAHLDSDRVE